MKYFTSFLVCLLLMLSVSKAQQQQQQQQLQEIDTTNTLQKNAIWELRVPLTTFFERYNSFNIGINRRSKSVFEWGFEIGYIFNMYQLYGIGINVDLDDGLENAYGGKLMAHFRYRLKDQFTFDGGEWYLSLSPYLYYMNYDVDLIAGYECNDVRNTCTYYRLFETNTHRYVPGIFLNMEKVFTMERTSITVYAGLGLRYTINDDQIPKVPEVGQLYNRNGEQSSIPDGISANSKIGFVVGYRIK